MTNLRSVLHLSMSNLKELTWEHHKNAERQDFVKELMGGISANRYCDFLHNQHPQYNLLENFAKLHGLTDVIIAPKIHAEIGRASCRERV